MLTIDPAPAAIIAGSTARVSVNAPVTLTPMTRSHMASVVSCSGEKSSLMPATLARPSMRAPAAATIASTDSWAVMSPATVTISAAAPRRSAANASSFSAEMSTAITRPPSRATRDAVARPMPLAAPVTMTVLPAKRPGVTFSTQPVGADSPGATPPFACSTRSSTTDCGIWPWLDGARRRPQGPQSPRDRP